MENSFVKYREIEERESLRELVRELSNREVDVFEKIDGGLCQIRNINGQLVAGNKANFLRGMIVRKSEWFSRLVNWMHSHPEFYQLPQNLILFGEWSGNHTIQYNPENINNFYLIDVLNLESKRFLKFEEGEGLVRNFGVQDIRYARPLFKGIITREILEKLLLDKSELYEGPKEGLIIKDYESTKQPFYKILGEGFAEKRQKIFGRIDPFTDARIRKAMFRIYDERGEIPIGTLTEEVAEDVVKEIGRRYRTGYVGKRVTAYLQRVKTESELLRHIKE